MYSKSDLKDKTKEELLELVLDFQFCSVNLAAENANLKEILRLKTAEKFTPTSEQTDYLFEELELLADIENQTNGLPESEQIVVPAHTRKKSKKRENSTLPSSTPVIDINNYEDAPETKVINGVLYKRVEDKTIDKVYIVPQKYVIIRDHYLKYEPADTSDTENTSIVEFKNKDLDGIAASQNFIAHSIVSKFDDYLPFYRQEEIHERAGLIVKRQKLAGWIIKYYEGLLPLEKVLKKQVYSSAMLHKDETKTTVLNVRTATGKVSQNSFMYITLGTTFNEKEASFHTLVLCEYIQGRSTDVLLDDIKRFNYTGPVITDGLKQYLQIENHGTCWVHLIRGFKKVLKATSKTKDANAYKLVSIYGKLSAAHYDLVDKLKSKEISKDEFLAQRRALSEPLIKEFYEKIDDIKSKYPESGLMGKAINYALEYKPYMSLYLDYVEGTPDTNNCERIAKCWATGRKSWLFSETVDGADASSFFMSLIETAKCANVATNDYIEYVLTFAPYGSTDEAEWEKMLPWNIDLKRLQERRALIATAKVDNDRTTPYILCGNSR